MTLPRWLYRKSVDRFGLRIRRFGSRRPLRFVLTIVDQDSCPPHYLLGIGPLGLQWGVEDGVIAGHSELPPGSRSHIWFFAWAGDRALGITWDGSGW